MTHCSRLNLNAPAGTSGYRFGYYLHVDPTNTSTKTATAVTLNGAPSIYIVVPIPARTVLKAGQVFPAGTLYTTSQSHYRAIGCSLVRRGSAVEYVDAYCFPRGATLAAGASVGPINMIVTINTGINASIPIDEIGDAFAKNVEPTHHGPIGDDRQITATSTPTSTKVMSPDGHGVIWQTTLIQTGSVLLGPSGAPAAVGPTDNNDDYTNKSSNPANIAPGGVTTAVAQLVYTNTLQNTGNANDTYTLDAPTVPAGFTVEISTNGGTSYTDVSSGGSTSLAVGFGASANILVRVTVPVGKLVLTAFSTTVRATSLVTPANNNRTIDRSYTGFVQLNKTFSVANGTGVGGATDAVPGAVITYNITYTNISSSNGDANCVKLTASNLVVTEDGNVAPNNWGGLTTHVAPATDPGGTVVVVSATKYTDTVASVAPGARVPSPSSARSTNPHGPMSVPDEATWWFSETGTSLPAFNLSHSPRPSRVLNAGLSNQIQQVTFCHRRRSSVCLARECTVPFECRFNSGRNCHQQPSRSDLRG